MSLVSMKSLLARTRRGETALPAFNVDNLEILEGVIQAATELNEPIIVAVGQGAIRSGRISSMAELTKSMAQNISVPIALHLDHATDVEQIMFAVQIGFTSIMYDGSSLPLNENIKNSKRVQQILGDKDISLEAELGALDGSEDGICPSKSSEITFDDVQHFLKEVTVDALALAIGNAHGIYKVAPTLNYKLLREVSKFSRVPLVLHGGSGLNDNVIRKLIACGIQKINVATELRIAFMKGIQKTAGEDFALASAQAVNHVKKVALAKIKLFTTSGKEERD